MAGPQKKSKKQSAGSGRQPDSPVFFLDEGLAGNIVPGILSDAGFLVEKLIDHFPKGTPDTVWLAEVGKRGWVVLTKDKKIRTNQLERKALMDAKVAAFILTSGNLRGEEMGEIFLKAHSRMLKFLSDNTRPFIATVTRDGKVTKYM